MTTSSNLLKSFNDIDYNSKIILQIFLKDLSKNIFYNNIDYLILNSDIYAFSNNRWTYNPHLFCYDIYTFQYYYPIILLVNKIPSIFDFKIDNLSNGIITPKKSSISKVLSYLSL